MREVAEKAGVSATTVSHVINKTRFVSEETRSRVLAAMDELNYRPNELARSLRRGRTTTIGLILPDSANPFFAEIGRSIEAAAFKRGYSVILCNTEGNLERERFYVDVLRTKQVTGIIFVAAGARTDSVRDLLRDAFPVVLVDRELENLKVDAVLADNRGGGRLAVQHLVDLGHRRIGCIRGPSDVTPSADRVTGYREILQEAGTTFDETLLVKGNFHPDSGREGIHELLSVSDPPTAIFACNDMMAVGALRAAVETGHRVPADLAIIGYDGIELSAYTIPQLTTVSQPILEMGRTAVQLLLERIADENLPPRRRLLPPKLVVRGSCGGKV